MILLENDIEVKYFFFQIFWNSKIETSLYVLLETTVARVGYGIVSDLLNFMIAILVIRRMTDRPQTPSDGKS
jgi:hypothetical protein